MLSPRRRTLPTSCRTGMTLPKYRARKSAPVCLAACSREVSSSAVNKAHLVGSRLAARCADYPAARPDHYAGLAIVTIAGGFGSESDIVPRIAFFTWVIRYILFLSSDYTVEVAALGGPDGIVLGSRSQRSARNFKILRRASRCPDWLDKSRTRTLAHTICGSRDHLPAHRPTASLSVTGIHAFGRVRRD